MKKLYLILLSVFALLNTAVAQELKVKSFVLAPTDIYNPQNEMFAERKTK